MNLANILPTLPHSERDFVHIEYLKEQAYGYVYTEDGEAFKIVSSNLAENTFCVLDIDENMKHFSIDDVSMIPNDEDFQNYKKSLCVFEAFLPDGSFNTDPEFHRMFAETTVVDDFEDIKNHFSKDDVFITNSTNLYLVYNKKDKSFFGISLIDDFCVDSLDLALKNNYEFNK